MKERGVFMLSLVVNARKKRIFQIVMLAVLVFFSAIFAKAETTENAEYDDGWTRYQFNMQVTRNYDYAWQILDMVNEERAKAGVQPVQMDEELTEFAMERAKEISFMFCHSRPKGISIYRSLFLVLGENILITGTNSPSHAMNVWMDSEGHKDNLLDADWKSVGIGFVGFEGNYFCVQEFCMREAAGSELIMTGERSAKEQITVSSKFLSMQPEDYQNKMYSEKKQELSLRQTNTDLSYYCYVPESDSFDYASSNENVATVNAKGCVTALSQGRTTLTAYYAGTSDIAWSKTLQVLPAKTKEKTSSQKKEDKKLICLENGGYYDLNDTYRYSGKPVKPNISIWYDAKRLKKGKDYTVSYKNNTSPGTASLYVQGIGNYTGTLQCTFRIVPKKYKVVFKNGKKRTVKYTKWNTSVKKIKKPKRKGYRFVGWYTKTGKKLNSSTKVHKNLVVYAKWQKNR